jgi:glycosyltransferase involved in cell wall biosynthesis
VKVAFVIPFSFEKFFQDCSYIHPDAELFEDQYLSKRITWHLNWCRAMTNAGIDVTLFHLSMYGKTVRYYKHSSGIPMVRIPVTGIDKVTGDEFSSLLFHELDSWLPDLVFSVTHVLRAKYDMYDRIVSYCISRNIPVATRNAHADTLNLLFRRSKDSHVYFRQLLKKRDPYSFLKAIYTLIKSGYFFLRERGKFRIKKNSLRGSDIIIIQTDKDHNNLLARFRLKDEQILHIPKPVDLDIFHEIPKERAAVELCLPVSAYYLLHVSNLVNRKGCDAIIKILPQIRVVYPEIRLIVTGNGGERAYLERLTLEKGMQDHVIFPGHVDHKKLALYYNIADVFVLPTDLNIEGQANAILESIACKTIPVSTDFPGPAAVISPQIGILIHPNDEKALREAILQVLSGEFQMDPRAYKNFLSEYSFDNLGKKLYRSFDNVILNKKNLIEQLSEL